MHLLWLCSMLVLNVCLAAEMNEKVTMRRLQQVQPTTPTVPETIEINGQIFALVPADQLPATPATPIEPLPVEPSLPVAPVAPEPPVAPMPVASVAPVVIATQPPVPTAPMIPTPPGGWPAGFEPINPGVTPQTPAQVPQAPQTTSFVPQPPHIPLFSTTLAPQVPQAPVVPFPPALSVPGTTTAAPFVPTMPVPPGGWPVTLQMPQFTPPVPTAPATTTTRLPLPGHTFGAFGQDCPTPTGLEQCQLNTDVMSDQVANTAGRVSCSMASDCCLCKQIQCGQPGSTPCDTLSISGDNAAFGVKDIQVNTGDRGVGMAVVQCLGTGSCQQSKIVANGVRAIECRGRHSCQDATIIVDDPTIEFSLECSVTSSCEGLNLVINYNGPASGNVCDPDPLARRDIMMGDIACVGVNSCKNMKFTINNNGCDSVIIRNVELRADTAVGAVFNFFGSSPVGIQSCQLPVTGMPTGLDRCFTNLKALSCSDRASCMGQTRTIVSPANNFMLECVNEMACANAQFTFEIPADVKSPPTELIRILCNSPMACQGLKIIANNANAVPVYFEVTCSGMGACDQANFELGHNAFLPEVVCGSASECMGCMSGGQTCGGHPAMITNPTPQYPGNNYPGLPAGQFLPGTPYAVPAPQAAAPVAPSFLPATPHYQQPLQPQQTLQPWGFQQPQPQQPQQPQPTQQPWGFQQPQQPYNAWWAPQTPQHVPQQPMNGAPQFVYNPHPFV